MIGSHSSVPGLQVKIAFREFSELHPLLIPYVFMRNRVLSAMSRDTRDRPSLVAGPDSTSSARPETDIERESGSETVLYLAYGSNLASETFLGRRAIKPLSQQNVVVPELSLSFDLPGIPYAEPCFANTRRRQPSSSSNVTGFDSTEKVALISAGDGPEYHKDRWKKGLVGVVYEVTKKDYATIIATEGGGAAYHDVLVNCHPLSDGPTVPEFPDNEPFKAHTLFAQPLDSNDPNAPDDDGRIHRADPSYAQPSARYLKLITDGGEEHKLPTEYMSYLYDIRPYTVTEHRQRLGKFIFLSIWMPILGIIFGAGGLFADKHGRSPKWFADLSSAIFRGIWESYDEFFKKLFGDGERTVGQDVKHDYLDFSRSSDITQNPRTRLVDDMKVNEKDRKYKTFST
ncbi:MAG: hypothetical protein M4579_003822 [Chaenotheca gracillima]|nr:MAG: hypothetical protein M4579_003822 [Chaenotheca gracillima]